MQQIVSLLRILLLAQHVSGITMPIIRSSRVLYSGCCLWVVCPVCGMLGRKACSVLQMNHLVLKMQKTPELKKKFEVLIWKVGISLVYVVQFIRGLEL